MNVRNWLKERFGNDTGRHLLDPRVYPNEELEGDIYEVKFELERKGQRIKQLNRKYQALIEAGAEATSPERSRLSMDAENVSRQHTFATKKYRKLTKKLGLLYAIKGTRELLDDSLSELTIDEVLEGAQTEEITTEIRDQLRSLHFEDGQIDEILAALDFSAEIDATTSVGAAGPGLNTSKHEERMQDVAESQASLEFDLNEELEDDDELEPPLQGL